MNLNREGPSLRAGGGSGDNMSKVDVESNKLIPARIATFDSDFKRVDFLEVIGT